MKITTLKSIIFLLSSALSFAYFDCSHFSSTTCHKFIGCTLNDNKTCEGAPEGNSEEIYIYSGNFTIDKPDEYEKGTIQNPFNSLDEAIDNKKTGTFFILDTKKTVHKFTKQI